MDDAEKRLNRTLSEISERSERLAKEPLPPGKRRGLKIGEWVQRRIESGLLAEIELPAMLKSKNDDVPSKRG